MNSLLIFEGIASSGKTTLERLMHESWADSAIVSEGRTLMPLIDNREVGAARLHLEAVLKEIQQSTVPNLIIDRFHFTHAFRTKTDLLAFEDLEARLRRLDRKVAVIFLFMDESIIWERIKESEHIRGAAWSRRKAGTDEERALYYREQQRTLLELMRQSSLPVCAVNTTDKNWDRCLQEIRRFLAREERV